ncbi:MAG: hypothetical protein IT521_12435 [Burkholderiales bacterium]|nr:hypothetical protein [Burkholderiales bacterium]
MSVRNVTGFRPLDSVDCRRLQWPELAGCRQPPRSPVRPLSNAQRAFNTKWPLAPYGSGMNGRQGWQFPTVATGESTIEEAAVDDVVTKINERR